MKATGYLTLKIKVDHTAHWNGDISMAELKQTVEKEIGIYLDQFFRGSQKPITILGDKVVSVVVIDEQRA